MGDAQATRIGSSPPLTIELVPSTSWRDNLRSRLSNAAWKQLRHQQYQRAQDRCEICGGQGKQQGYRWDLECHEIWAYDEAHHIQKLLGLVALCPDCHKVKHFGRTSTEGEREALRALLHLMRVNHWTRPVAESYIHRAFQQWGARSQHTWVLDLSWLETA